jgi:DNA-binding transcriptional LysR family regulator
MDRFHLMNVYVAVAEEAGFNGAARRLGMSPPAVTRAIAALEKHLGVKLLNRTTRMVRMTEAGQRYLEDARRVLAEADAADEAVTGISSDPRGHLALTAPVLFGRMYIMPGIVEFLELHAEIEISALFLDRNVNLLEEGLDLGVRIGELADSSMRAIRVGSVRQIVCAAPEYLQRFGLPQTPKQLAQHRLIASSAVSNPVIWKFSSPQGLRNQRIKPRLTVTTNDAAVEAAVQGFGITRLLSYQSAAQVAEGRLQILLQDFEPEPWPIHIVHREARNHSTKTRRFIDFLTHRLKSDPRLN